MVLNRQCAYVVLHHTGYGEPHYDFMIAIDDFGPLRTWRSPVWPIDESTVLEPLADHRRIYLSYEGPVSNGRGQVRRIASGTLLVNELASEKITLTIDERQMTIKWLEKPV